MRSHFAGSAFDTPASLKRGEKENILQQLAQFRQFESFQKPVRGTPC
jgi:hypothetical protein